MSTQRKKKKNKAAEFNRLNFPPVTSAQKEKPLDSDVERSHYNMLNRVAGGAIPSDLSLTERVVLMSTYEEFMVMLTFGLLIVAILNLKNK